MTKFALSINSMIFMVLFAFLIFTPKNTPAQDIAIGHWKHHLPNNNVVSLAEAPGKIFAATPHGLLEYEKQYNSIRKYDKVNGLSDFGINVVRYSTDKDILLMGYQNGNIDVKTSTGFFSIPDIRQANILGSKSINNILFDGNRAYLSCDFGVVVLDLTLFVILDTWFIGPQGSMLKVYELAKTGTHFYAATEAGLLKAAIDAPNLADFQYWKIDNSLPLATGPFTQVLVHGNYLLANKRTPQEDLIFFLDDDGWQSFLPTTIYDFTRPKTSIRSGNGFLTFSSLEGIFIFSLTMELLAEYYWYLDTRVSANDGFYDQQGIFWVADQRMGLVKNAPGSGFESIRLQGPPTAESFGVAHSGNTLWLAPGAIIAGFQNTWNDRGIFLMQNGNWQSFNRGSYPALQEVRDIHTVTIHAENPNRAFAGAWSGGLAEFDTTDGLIALYDETNSSLQRRASAQDRVRVGGSAFDSRGNLWVSNSEADHFISVRKTDGQWLSYPHNGLITGNETLGQVVIDNLDQKWVTMPRGGGLMVFKEESLDNNQGIDIRRLTSQAGNGSLPGTRVTALAGDNDGYIWVGTNEGVVVFYSPQNVFRQQSIDAQSIIVVAADGFAGRLFENETINSIFVDGSNKKWFGTVSSGAFLLSSDGRETIKHFTRANSPLPSNNILDIAVDPVSGEVFFATDLGLVSYRGFATQGQRQHSDVYAFPNPVRPGYGGFIAIKGLVTNARVKITDINGNLVHDGFAEGGQFVWNGNNLYGQKPGSGVYLVFSTDPQGNETMVTKILFMQ